MTAPQWIIPSYRRTDVPQLQYVWGSERPSRGHRTPGTASCNSVQRSNFGHFVQHATRNRAE